MKLPGVTWNIMKQVHMFAYIQTSKKQPQNVRKTPGAPERTVGNRMVQGMRPHEMDVEFI